MGGVPGGEHPVVAVLSGRGDAQLPELDMIKFNVKFRSCGVFQQRLKVEIVLCGIVRHRCVNESCRAEISPAKKHPIVLIFLVQHAVELFALKPFKMRMKPVERNTNSTILRLCSDTVWAIPAASRILEWLPSQATT